MKKPTSISALLGATQDNMAMLLRVTRSQYAMFEIGKRDLPLRAQQLLANVLTYVNAPERLSKNAPQTIRDQAKRQALESLLSENEYQQLRIAKEIRPLQDKQQSRIRLHLLIDFLTNHQDNDINKNGILTGLAGKVSESSIKEDETLLAKLLIKQEMLVLEKLIIQSQLHRISVITEDVPK